MSQLGFRRQGGVIYGLDLLSTPLQYYKETSIIRRSLSPYFGFYTIQRQISSQQSTLYSRIASLDSSSLAALQAYYTGSPNSSTLVVQQSSVSSVIVTTILLVLYPLSQLVFLSISLSRKSSSPKLKLKRLLLSYLGPSLVSLLSS